jgi:endonuclease V-like protein UPF0215 family
MKSGVRALGVAESFREDRSTLAGAIVRADRTADGFAFGTCTVGGLDATDAVVSLFADLGREDVRYVLVAGIAPAWFNILDLHRIHEATSRPVLSVTFEASSGLESALEDAFEGDELERRLERYRAQPDRRNLRVNGETVYLRSVGIDDGEANDVVRAFTPEGGRPEPLRVARLAARAAETFRADVADDH